MDISTKYNVNDWVEFETKWIDLKSNASKSQKVRFKVLRIVIETFWEDDHPCSEITYLGRTDGDENNYDYDAEIMEDELERWRYDG